MGMVHPIFPYFTATLDKEFGRLITVTPHGWDVVDTEKSEVCRYPFQVCAEDIEIWFWAAKDGHERRYGRPAVQQTAQQINYNAPNYSPIIVYPPPDAPAPAAASEQQATGSEAQRKPETTPKVDPSATAGADPAKEATTSEMSQAPAAPAATLQSGIANNAPKQEKKPAALLNNTVEALIALADAGVNIKSPPRLSDLLNQVREKLRTTLSLSTLQRARKVALRRIAERKTDEAGVK
jgi:hypothetical protein